MAVMDRSQHRSFLVYLERYAYFGRGQPKLDAQTFAAMDSEYQQLAAASDDASRARRRELAKTLLRD